MIGGVPDPDGVRLVVTRDGLAEWTRDRAILVAWIVAATACLTGAKP